MCHFWKYMEVVKTSFCYGKTFALNGQEVQVLELLNARDLECQQGLFKLTMKSNARACMTPHLTLIFPLGCGDLWQHFAFWLLVSPSMSNWLSWLWCKWLVVWKMKDVSLFWCLWNLSFTIGWQPICYLLCKCLCKTFILYNYQIFLYEECIE
jgi:hypothetical protein